MFPNSLRLELSQDLQRMLLLKDAGADQRIGVISEDHPDHGPAALGEDRRPRPEGASRRAPEIALPHEGVPRLDFVRVADGDLDLSVNVSDQHIPLACGEFSEFGFADRGHRHG
jgi:hypothetical protein